jgi:radical SAM protein with 4Fe4S-binding SPASM domain
MNTNGALADREKVKFLADHFYHLTLTLSLGSAYETYGGVEKAILLLRPIAEQIASINGRWGVNFVVTHPERLYEDCKIMKDYGIENILIDIPRFVEISDSYADLFIESYRKVVQEFKLKDGRGLEQGMKYCGSGIDKILVDPSGDVYPCDGFYGLRFKKLGNIYHEFDMGNFEFFKNLKNEVACFYANCKDCPTQCWFERCMTANIIKNKDMFSPDPNWCKIRKIFKELRKEEAVYV